MHAHSPHTAMRTARSCTRTAKLLDAGEVGVVVGWCVVACTDSHCILAGDGMDEQQLVMRLVGDEVAGELDSELRDCSVCVCVCVCVCARVHACMFSEVTTGAGFW